MAAPFSSMSFALGFLFIKLGQRYSQIEICTLKAKITEHWSGPESTNTIQKNIVLSSSVLLLEQSETYISFIISTYSKIHTTKNKKIYDKEKTLKYVYYF
jgi:hypothetical protein